MDPHSRKPQMKSQRKSQVWAAAGSEGSAPLVPKCSESDSCGTCRFSFYTTASNRFGKCLAGCTCVRQLQFGYPWTHTFLFVYVFISWVGQFIHAEMVVENLEPCAAKTRTEDQTGQNSSNLFKTLRTCWRVLRVLDVLVKYNNHQLWEVLKCKI